MSRYSLLVPVLLTIALLPACVSAGSGSADAQQPPAQSTPQGAPSAPQRLDIPTYSPVPALQLKATMVREYQAPEARQGVAVDANHFYAVVNNVVAKYDKATGSRVAYWASPRGGPIRHINSCIADGGELWCANSNFPETPMASSIEVIDAATMTHVRSHSLGVLDEGSLTFFERLGGGWIAGFAHYDEDSGLPFKNSSYAGIVSYDADWRRLGGWMIPAAVRERMAPHAASGGGIGPDGLLYLFGHDRPEMYVFAKPKLGPVLVHIATIDVDAAGQAFTWDVSKPGTLYAINRPNGTVRVFDMPAVALTNPEGERFR
ncbi:hypothetical protein GC169_08450 [bacterium]|nr:hypothetical protein [bacterium]